MGARPKCPREFDRRFRAGIRAGLFLMIRVLLPACPRRGQAYVPQAGGVNPTRVCGPVGRYLSWSEREEIAALEHARHGVRETAGTEPGSHQP